MREFVFRGKPKNEAEYEPLRELSEDDCENGFVYGSLVASHNKYYICTMALQIRGGISDYITTMIDVLPDTVGQYTGLKDKNGTKIFEGDIVKCVDENNGGSFTALVSFGNPNCQYNWGFQLVRMGGDNLNTDILLWVDMEETGAYIEVISNIYDAAKTIGGNNNGTC